MSGSVVFIVFISIAFAQCSRLGKEKWYGGDQTIPESCKNAGAFYSNNGKETLVYEFGEKGEIDERLAHLEEHNFLDSKQDVDFIVTYPTFNNGDPNYVITYLNVTIAQDTPEGSAEIISGGIGQTFLQVRITAKATSNLYHFVFIFGHKLT